MTRDCFDWYPGVPKITPTEARQNLYLEISIGPGTNVCQESGPTSPGPGDNIRRISRGPGTNVCQESGSTNPGTGTGNGEAGGEGGGRMEEEGVLTKKQNLIQGVRKNTIIRLLLFTMLSVFRTMSDSSRGGSDRVRDVEFESAITFRRTEIVRDFILF